MFYSAFIMGFIGSLHCVGMCGPIAMMLPADNSKRGKFIMGRVLYNGGRILTYAFLGLLVGFIGESTIYFISQKSLSILLGVLILIGVFLPKGTPLNVSNRLTKEILNIINQSDTQADLAKNGVIANPGGPDEMSALLKKEIAEWRKTVDEAKIVAD